jgi:dTDP-4-dehydrorhamnose reductase
MSRIIVIGAAGQLGGELLAAFGSDAIGLTRRDLDVTKREQVFEVLRAFTPDWVINAAAFTRVDDSERDAEAFAVNAHGAGNVAGAAAALGARSVYFSTDYVFGAGIGLRAFPYVETDKPTPVNRYGQSKLLGEKLVRQADPRHLIVRTAGLYGKRPSRKGWNFPARILDEARRHGRVRVVSDQAMTTTYCPDLVNRVRSLMHADARGVFHVANSGACTWHDVAVEVLRLANVAAHVTPIAAAQSDRPARRPAYSVLASLRLRDLGIAPARPWRHALRAHLHEIGEGSRAAAA